MKTHATIRRKHQRRRRITALRAGFSLIELMVVIALILLISGATLPSIITIFNAGAEAQAYNLLTAQLTAARALAIQEATYTAVHVQRVAAGDADATYLSHMTDTFYSAVMIYADPDETDNNHDRYFQLADGFTPRKLPGAAAFGEIDAAAPGYKSLAQADLEDFTTLSIVFSPNGSVVRNVAGGDIVFRTPSEMATLPGSIDADPIFENVAADDETKLWNPDVANRDTDGGTPSLDGEPGTTAVVVFDFPALRAIPAAGTRDDYLDQNARLVPVNIHTGQLFER